MIYIYEGILSSGATLVQLGEEQFGQEGINFGFTLDGTKDSCKFEVYSYRKESVKPFSVVCHHETSSWWIVSKDKVERFTNEQGWIYKHSLQCIGAIELLNARDLTNCAFNQGKYTIQEYVERLFELSNFEFKSPDIIHNNNIDIHQLVDYIKTFENYTLLSALREFFDGYNCSLRLEFIRNLTYNQITGVNLVITPKTGDMSLQVLDIDNDFNNVQEQRNMDKSSYGTIVVSNVDNAVSSKTKTYPNVGGARLTSNDYNISPDNAIIKLPSNAFMVEEIDMCMQFGLVLQLWNGSEWSNPTLTPIYNTIGNVANNIDEMLDNAKEDILEYRSENFDPDDFESKRNEMKTLIYNGGTVRFKQGIIFDPTDNSYHYKDNSYTPKTLLLRHSSTQYFKGQVVLMDKETGQATHNTWNVIKWERGNDEISGFGWISYDKYSQNIAPSTGGECFIPADQTILGQNECVIYEWNYTKDEWTKARIIIPYRTHAWNTSNNGVVIIGGTLPCLYVNNFYKNDDGTKYPALFKIKYIPMTDLKVKLDNNEENNEE